MWRFLVRDFPRRTVLQCLAFLLGPVTAVKLFSDRVFFTKFRRPKPNKFQATPREMEPRGSLELYNISTSLWSHKFAVSPNVSEPEQSQAGGPSVKPKSVDKSEALFTMYLERSGEDDRKTTEKWRRECDAILIFVSRPYKGFLRTP